MSDVRAEPVPDTTSPEAASTPPRPDPLAGDWSEGLPGPVRAHGLPLPVRVGEARPAAAAAAVVVAETPAPDPTSLDQPLRPTETPWSEPVEETPRADGWTMAPPVVEPAAEPAWTAQPHDAGFAAVAAPQAEAWSAGAEPETWQESKEPSPWTGPAQPTDWDPNAQAGPSPEEKWAAPADAEPTQEWSASGHDAPTPVAVADDEAAALLRPVDEVEAASLLRPVHAAANDEPPGEPISLLYPPGDLDPALQPIMDPTLQPLADGEALIMLNPHDHPDLPAPVNDDAPPMATGGVRRSGTVVAGEHRVAIHTRGGQTRRGSVTDVDLGRAQFALQPQGGGSTEIVPHSDVKAIFFMLAPGEVPVTPDGGKVRVTLSDGRSIEGHRDGADGPQGFFLVPVDAQKTNTKRIYIARAAVSAVKDV